MDFTPAQKELLKVIMTEHKIACKNWLVTAVENGNYERAKNLARDIRTLESIKL